MKSTSPTSSTTILSEAASRSTPPVTPERAKKKTYTEALNIPPPLLDDDTTTTNSMMTRSLDTTQMKFTELEGAIRKQNATIKDYQAEFGIQLLDWQVTGAEETLSRTKLGF